MRPRPSNTCEEIEESYHLLTNYVISKKAITLLFLQKHGCKYTF